MINEFANRQAMHLTVVNLLDDPAHTPVWFNQAPTMFTNKSITLRNLVGELTAKIAEQEAALTGRAEQKEREETELETAAHEVCQAFAAYLIDQEREAEAGQIDLSLSGWRRLRDTALLAKATLLETRLAAEIAHAPPALAAYGLGAAELASLTAEIADYREIIESPSAGIASRKALTAALRPSFRDCAVVLKAMDRLVLRFRTSPAGKAFADNWVTARVIRDLGANNPATPAPPTT